MKHRKLTSTSKTLFFTTSPRTPSKLIPEVELLINDFEGRPWNKETQSDFMKALSTQDFFEQVAPTKNLDFSARDRVNRGPQLLGFVNLENGVAKTKPYEKLITGKRTNELFLRQMLKFQVPSPLRPESDDSTSVFWCRPYLEIIRLIYEMGYLSRDEMAIYGMQLTNYHKFDEVKEKIADFRSKKTLRSGISYSKFIRSISNAEVLALFSDVISLGKAKKRENKGKTSTVEEFVSTKVRNMYDYADACRRYLRITGLVNVDIKRRSVSIAPNRAEETKWLLDHIDREPVFVSDLEKYQRYLFDTSAPKLYSDNRTQLCQRLSKFGYQNDDLMADTVDGLKDKYELALSESTKESISKEEQSLRTYEDYDDIMGVFQSLADRNTPDRPLLLEWNTWRAMTMLDHGMIDGNFSRDMNGNPEETAGPGEPDIICHYKDYDLIIEVTMQSGHRQYNSEGEPVADHVGEHRIATGKPTYCLFIAPVINDNVITYFYGIDQMNMRSYGGKSQIIPMTIDMFQELIKVSKQSKEKPSSDDIREFLDKTISDISGSSNEDNWYESIKANINDFMKITSQRTGSSIGA